MVNETQEIASKCMPGAGVCITNSGIHRAETGVLEQGRSRARACFINKILSARKSCGAKTSAAADRAQRREPRTFAIDMADAEPDGDAPAVCGGCKETLT
eukprot:4203884-Pleurochrysis_carterae.AAC.1